MTSRTASLLTWLLGVFILLSALLAVLIYAGVFGLDDRIPPSVDSTTASARKVMQPALGNAITSSPSQALETPAITQALGLLADIRVHDAAELLSTLSRVNELFERGDIAVGTDRPVVFLLHGNEAKTLYLDQYDKHKKVVDLAAKLSAFGVVNIKVCDRWAGNRGLDKTNLQPFVGTVSFAPAEERRLLEEQGYIYF